MTKDFEIWLSANERALNGDTLGLFRDSLKCFKNDIDRPSFLLAYQGMLMQVRSNILNSSRPADFPEGRWNAMIGELARVEKWDEVTFDAIQKKEVDRGGVKEPPVVQVQESVREAFKYWRDLRNTCAHYKDSIFTKAHTLTLYAFIQQNLLSMTVEGGFAKLMNEFQDYYTPSKVNRASTPIQPLLQKICTVIIPSERDKFVEKLLYHLDSRYRIVEAEELMRDMWLFNAELKTILMNYLRKNEGIKWQFVDMCPRAVLDLYQPDEIHELWYKYIPKMEHGEVVLCELLVADKIDKNDYEEMPRHILEQKFSVNAGAAELTQVQIGILQQIKYFDVFMEHYMDSAFTSRYGQTQKLNSKCRFYVTNLACVDFSKQENAQRIHDVFAHTYHPYLVANDFREYLREMPDRYSMLKGTFDQMGLVMPEAILVGTKSENVLEEQ